MAFVSDVALSNHSLAHFQYSQGKGGKWIGIR